MQSFLPTCRYPLCKLTRVILTDRFCFGADIPYVLLNLPVHACLPIYGTNRPILPVGTNIWLIISNITHRCSVVISESVEYDSVNVSIEEQSTYHIVLEILETERSYVKKLRYLAKVGTY